MRSFLISCLFSAVAVFTSLAEAFPVPTLTGPVMDQAGMMSAPDIARAESAIRTSNDAGQIQLQVLTVPSLNDEPIEEVSYQLVKGWKLGETKTDKGVLLLISKNDRKMRIEVGQGLEGAIPDIYSKQIISDVMIPYFKEGRTSEGIVAGVGSILQLAANESGGLPQAKRYGGSKRSLQGWMNLVILLIFIVFILIKPRRRGFGSGAMLGGLGGFGAGGGFGGSFGGGGGGGWSGGGGGFSGGGSSGSW